MNKSSQEILPLNKRLSELDINQLEGFGRNSPSLKMKITEYLILYHKALLAAEQNLRDVFAGKPVKRITDERNTRRVRKTS